VKHVGGSSSSIANATDLLASTLPAASRERYSTTWSPSSSTVNVVTNGSASSPLSERCHSPVEPSVFTRYSV
jgi:hypothetical protein